MASFINFGADLLAPGRILQGNAATVRVGEPGGGAITPRVAELAWVLPYAQATGNIMGFLWGKEAYGAMLFAGAVSPLSIAETLEGQRWRRGASGPVTWPTWKSWRATSDGCAMAAPPHRGRP